MKTKKCKCEKRAEKEGKVFGFIILHDSRCEQKTQ